MTTRSVVESGMTFGPYPEEQCFFIEASDCYHAIKDGVKMAEFLLLRVQQEGPTVLIVEAKSSSPRPETQPSFGEFIDEIRCKFTNAFLLSVAAWLQRHPATSHELPEPFRELDLGASGFRFVLVINGHKAEWLPPLKDELSRTLRPIVKTWALAAEAVVVINDEMARTHGLIS